MTVYYDTATLTPMMRGRLERHLAQLVRYGNEVMTRRELYARGVECRTLHDGRGTQWMSIPTPESDTGGVVVPAMVLETWRIGEQPAACRSCGHGGGAHGLVHVRHGNGGGHNRPCPKGAA